VSYILLMTTTNTISRGTVVSYVGRTRRYAVTTVFEGGRFNMAALTGGSAGSAPSSVRPEEVVVCDDQALTFSGKEALVRQRTYESKVRIGV
jgi:hypothetical protein